jgi:hypothetical protein
MGKPRRENTYIGNERRWKLFPVKCLPVDSIEPRMLLNLIQAVSPWATCKALERVSLQQLGGGELEGDVAQVRGGTHPSYEAKAPTTALLLGVLGKT